jgi:hypothetical protein
MNYYRKQVEKSTIIYFPNKNKPQLNIPVIIDDKPVHQNANDSFLGLTMDSQLFIGESYSKFAQQTQFCVFQ